MYASVKYSYSTPPSFSSLFYAQVADTPSAPEAAAPAPVAVAMATPPPVPVAGGPVTDRPVSSAEVVRAIVALKLKKKVQYT